MNVFFGMDVPGANPNDPSFFLRLPHLWQIFVIPAVCFYAILTVWVVRTVRSAIAGGSAPKAGNRPPGPGDPSIESAARETSGLSEEVKPPSPVDPDFYRWFPLTS